MQQMLHNQVLSKGMEKCKGDSYTQSGQDQTLLYGRIPGYQLAVNSRLMPGKASDRKANLLPRDLRTIITTTVRLHRLQIHSGRHKDRLRLRRDQQKTWSQMLPPSSGHSRGFRHCLAPKYPSSAQKSKVSPKHVQCGERLSTRSHDPHQVGELPQHKTGHQRQPPRFGIRTNPVEHYN